MNVLFTVWELDPFFKIGGLGDVARALPGALKELGVDIRVMTPYYKVAKFGRTKKEKVCEFKIMYAGKNETVEIWEIVHPYKNFVAYFLKNKKYLDRALPRETWGFFDKAVVEIIKNNLLSWRPDIIHLNDSHCGFIPLLVRLENLPVKTMLTIHNLAYQKKTSTTVVRHIGIDPASTGPVQWEIKGNQINLLLEGIINSDMITTVSPTYAKEILTEELGNGLNEVLKARQEKIFGILNGIDADFSQTTHDRAINYPYDPVEKRGVNGEIKYYDWKKGKALNKEFLQKKLGLKVKKDIPLLCFIGRIEAPQKGLEILHKMLRRKSKMEFEIVILGSGDPDWEERFKWLSTFSPKYISCNFTYSDKLAHQIYAASDFIVIPSKYEPCGLVQMVAMLFGTIPIAHNTGGLKDSIKDGFNGYLFSTYNSDTLEDTIMKALDVWKNDKKTFETMVQNAFSTDFSWNKSAQEYLTLYQKLLG